MKRKLESFESALRHPFINVPDKPYKIQREEDLEERKERIQREVQVDLEAQQRVLDENKPEFPNLISVVHNIDTWKETLDDNGRSTMRRMHWSFTTPYIDEGDIKMANYDDGTPFKDKIAFVLHPSVLLTQVEINSAGNFFPELNMSVSGPFICSMDTAGAFMPDRCTQVGRMPEKPKVQYTSNEINVSNLGLFSFIPYVVGVLYLKSKSDDFCKQIEKFQMYTGSLENVDEDVLANNILDKLYKLYRSGGENKAMVWKCIDVILGANRDVEAAFRFVMVNIRFISVDDKESCIDPREFTCYRRYQFLDSVMEHILPLFNMRTLQGGVCSNEENNSGLMEEGGLGKDLQLTARRLILAFLKTIRNVAPDLEMHDDYIIHEGGKRFVQSLQYILSDEFLKFATIKVQEEETWNFFETKLKNLWNLGADEIKGCPFPLTNRDNSLYHAEFAQSCNFVNEGADLDPPDIRTIENCEFLYRTAFYMNFVLALPNVGESDDSWCRLYDAFDADQYIAHVTDQKHVLVPFLEQVLNNKAPDRNVYEAPPRVRQALAIHTIGAESIGLPKQWMGGGTLYDSRIPLLIDSLNWKSDIFHQINASIKANQNGLLMNQASLSEFIEPHFHFSYDATQFKEFYRLYRRKRRPAQLLD